MTLEGPATRPRLPPVEMSHDPAMVGRVRRLGFVSLVALGAVWGLSLATLDAGWGVSASLALGWVLMPTLLFASVRRPPLRYLLVVPSTLVSVALLVVMLTALPAAAASRLGWILIALGVWFGGLLGIWFWFRWLPVPPALDDPLAPARWSLIALHVTLVVAGLVLVSLAEIAAG